MAEEFETVELEISEDDILYYLVDEDGEEIGFVIEENGQEVECYYEGYEDFEFEIVDDEEDDSESVEIIEGTFDEDDEIELDLTDLDGEVVEMEIDEDSIDHFIFDEEGNEIGFAIVEDGTVIECYYTDEDDEDDDAAVTESFSEPTDNEPENHGYLYKMASIAGFEGNKARKKAGAQLNKAREKAEPAIDRARTKAEAGIDKATEVVESGGKKLSDKKDEYDLGITREGVAEATDNLNAIAKEGAATAKELKEAYDDIMDSFGFLMPKGVRRKLP